jgi:hypothetical protein
MNTNESKTKTVFNGCGKGLPALAKHVGRIHRPTSKPRFLKNLNTAMQCRCGWTQLSSPTTPVFYTARKTDVDAFATGQSSLISAAAAAEDASSTFCSVHPDGHRPETMVTRQSETPSGEGELEAAITPSAPVQWQYVYRLVLTCIETLQPSLFAGQNFRNVVGTFRLENLG